MTKTRKPNKTIDRDEIRIAVANYMGSEGCSCCRDIDAHREHEERLAKLLEVPAYKDGSGYDFARFRRKEKRTKP